jgi:hypothetical protein
MNSIFQSLPELQVFIYENNSSDDTKELLETWASQDSRIHVKSEDLSKAVLLEQGYARAYDNTPCRMEAISAARNKLMEWMESSGMGTGADDLTIFIDPDINTVFPVDCLVHICKSFPSGAHAFFANGLSCYTAKYYDAYAYRDIQHPFGAELMGEDIFDLKYRSVMQQIPFDTQPIPVLSAFGGIGVYKSSCIRGLRYSAVPTEDLHALNLRIMKENPDHVYVKKLKEKPTTHIQGVSLGVYLFDKELFYRSCSGYNFPVMCEHVPFHAAMIARGYDKLYVLPPLIYVSDH